jgi:hypothetical protein
MRLRKSSGSLKGYGLKNRRENPAFPSDGGEEERNRRSLQFLLALMAELLQCMGGVCSWTRPMFLLHIAKVSRLPAPGQDGKRASLESFPEAQ